MVRHDFVPRVGRVGNRFEPSESENETTSLVCVSMHGAPAVSDDHRRNCHSQRNAEPKAHQDVASMSGALWVGLPGRPFAGFSGLVAGAHAVRMMKIFH